MTSLTRSVQEFSTPTSVEGALRLKESLGAGATFLGGGTDLGVMVRRGSTQPTHLIHLGSIAELRSLEINERSVTIGAMVTHRTIERAGLDQGPLAGLVEACRTVGSRQTRSVGTIGGNICNASPAADVPPMLLALGADVLLTSLDGHRWIPIEEFFEAYRSTALANGEVLTKVRIPTAPTLTGTAFEKLGRRRAMEISVVCAGARVTIADDGTIADCGIALGSVAPTVVRVPSVEDALRGKKPTAEIIRESTEMMAKHLSPIDDIRASAAYRRRVAPVVTARALTRATERALATMEAV